jgi:hypothetical protein
VRPAGLLGTAPVSRPALLRLDLLFEADAELAERLERHPALLWKVQNVREYRALNR